MEGMNVCRLNFSHGSHEEHKRRMDEVKALRKELELPVALLLDTKGPEIRLCEFENGSIILEPGQEFTLTTDETPGNKERVGITYKNLYKDVKVGNHILIDDGLIDMTVISIDNHDITCRVNNGGKVSNKKGVNVPNVELSMPYLSERDMSDIKFGLSQDIDFIAASFVRTAEDVKQLKYYMEFCGSRDVKIIAKIENAQGVSNIDEIIDVAGRIYVKATAKVMDCASDDVIEVTAYAREADAKKGMDEAQITGATSSYARKYALNALYLLDDTKDVDSEEYQAQSKEKRDRNKLLHDKLLFVFVNRALPYFFYLAEIIIISGLKQTVLVCA